MSALAKFCFYKGFYVSGYDAAQSEQTEDLRALGIRISVVGDEIGEAKGADVVVYSDAIGEEDCRLVYAKKAGIRTLRRVELLRLICESFPNVVAVAGSHGKTTCTAMCAHILKQTGVGFCAHIGGEDTEFGNFYSCGDEFFVTEACEYKKNMLGIVADRKILLNIDKDHMECYDGEEDLSACFQRYLETGQEGFVCADDEKCMRFGRKFTTFGIDNPHCDYRAVDVRAAGEKYSFIVLEYGKAVGRVKLSTMGKCNVYNALAAFAAMRSYGFDEREIEKGLESFTAVKRRFETIGETKNGAKVFCDYAHHPKEIASTLATAERLCNGEVLVVFQPHTYSRTRLLMGEFVALFRKVKRLMIYKTYPAREFYDPSGSAKTLAENVGNCLYAESLRELNAWITSTVKPEDVVLFLGAGDVYYAARYLVREWNK